MSTIIFDYDGVLLDSFSTVLKCLNQLHEKYHLPELTKENLQDLFDGNFWEEHARFGLDEAVEKSFKEDVKELLLAKQGSMTFFAGIPEVIVTLSKRYKLFILSSNHAETIHQKLSKEGLDQYFEKISGAEERGNKKEKITKILQDKSGETYFITDTKGDLLEVSELPLTSIAVTWGYHSAERLLSVSPKRLIESPRELEGLVQ